MLLLVCCGEGLENCCNNVIQDYLEYRYPIVQNEVRLLTKGEHLSIDHTRTIGLNSCCTGRFLN